MINMWRLHSAAWASHAQRGKTGLICTTLVRITPCTIYDEITILGRALSFETRSNRSLRKETWINPGHWFVITLFTYICFEGKIVKIKLGVTKFTRTSKTIKILAKMSKSYFVIISFKCKKAFILPMIPRRNIKISVFTEFPAKQRRVVWNIFQKLLTNTGSVLGRRARVRPICRHICTHVLSLHFTKLQLKTTTSRIQMAMIPFRRCNWYFEMIAST